MKKILIVFIIFYSMCTTFAKSASAHVLKTDGSIGAVLHISPEDDPIAGKSTDFFFEFKDRDNRFKPESCDCKGIIIQDEKEIYSSTIFQNGSNANLESAVFSFAFPEKDIYKVQVSGKPIEGNLFQPFTLAWDIRVARENEAKSTIESNDSTFEGLLSEHLLNFVLISPAIMFMIYVIIKVIRGNKK